MAVLLECARCYQHYTVPKQALRRPTSCPWCGASSADSSAQSRKTAKRKQPSRQANGSANSGSNGFDEAAGDTPLPPNGDPASVPFVIEKGPGRGKAPRTNGRASLDSTVEPAAAPVWGDNDRAGGNGHSGDGLTNGKPTRISPNGTNGDRGARLAIVTQSSSPTLPPVLRPVSSAVAPVNGPPPVKPPIAPGAGIYPISPVHRASVHLRYERRLPALLWLAIGIGLGACVVLAVLSFWLNRSAREERNREPPRGAQERKEKLKSAPRTERPIKKQGSPGASPNKANRSDRAAKEDKPLSSAQSPVAAALVNRPSNETQPARARWKSERPPPVDDPSDDSPGIGLTVIEAAAARVNGPAAETTPKLEAVQADDAGAIAALAAAKIGLHKDENSGHVDQVDGSFRMTDSLLLHAAKLPGALRLKLSLSNVSDAGLAHIAEMTGLKELMLNETKVSDAGIAHLEKLIGLEKLDLEKTGVTDQCLAQLKRLTHLKHLDLRGTKVSGEAMKELKSALPGVTIRGM